MEVEEHTRRIENEEEREKDSSRGIKKGRGRGNELKRNLTSSGGRGDERAKVKRCFPAFSFRGGDIGATQFH